MDSEMIRRIAHSPFRKNRSNRDSQNRFEMKTSRVSYVHVLGDLQPYFHHHETHLPGKPTRTIQLAP
jgi:hypothetical protein